MQFSRKRREKCAGTVRFHDPLPSPVRHLLCAFSRLFVATSELSDYFQAAIKKSAIRGEHICEAHPQVTRSRRIPVRCVLYPANLRSAECRLRELSRTVGPAHREELFATRRREN